MNINEKFISNIGIIYITYFFLKHFFGKIIYYFSESMNNIKEVFVDSQHFKVHGIVSINE